MQVQDWLGGFKVTTDTIKWTPRLPPRTVWNRDVLDFPSIVGSSVEFTDIDTSGARLQHNCNLVHNVLEGCYTPGSPT